MKEFIIKVNGMMCEGCENRIQNSLKTIDGIENVVANHTNGTVTISAKDDSILETAKKRIENLDFEVIE